MTTQERILTIGTAAALGIIIDISHRGAKVSWVNEDGNVNNGTARSIGDQQGNFAGSNDDVRDCYLRITTQAGWEHFIPVTDIIPLIRSGEFTEYDWSTNERNTQTI